MKRLPFLVAPLALLVAAACGSETEGADPPATSTPGTPYETPAPAPGTGEAPTPETPAPEPSALEKTYRGVNLAGAEFNSGAIPGKAFFDYAIPSHEEVDYYVGKKMNIFRVPFLWRRIQPSDNGPLDAGMLEHLDDVVTYATGKGAVVVLDVHNYGRVDGQIVGEQKPAALLADLWSKLAGHYKDNPSVFFGLMNEPHGQSGTAWLATANGAIAAIREAGAKNPILVPGISWTGAHSWISSKNAETMLGVVDPANNYAFEVHQYLDDDSSGTHDDCKSATIGSERLKGFTGWARTNGKRALLGEFGVARNQTCYDGLDDILGYMDANPDVWMAWTYWAGGPWWGEYSYTLEPKDGKDRPQMAILEKHL